MMLSVLRVRCERQGRGSALLQALLLDYGGRAESSLEREPQDYGAMVPIWGPETGIR